MNPIKSFDHNSRILVVGTSGAGKSTLARKIALALSIKDIELDALHWGPNWTETPLYEFERKVRKEIQENRGFVIHGNYTKIQAITWGSVDTVLWLDYTRAVVMWRVEARTLRRIITKEKLWAGNVETFRKSFLGKDSIIAWAWNTYGRRKEQFAKLFEENPHQVQNLVRFMKPGEAKEFLRNLG
jgi:adenylate kinase family enzyme